MMLFVEPPTTDEANPQRIEPPDARLVDADAFVGGRFERPRLATEIRWAKGAVAAPASSRVCAADPCRRRPRHPPAATASSRGASQGTIE
jgi:hypothetical protein